MSSLVPEMMAADHGVGSTGFLPSIIATASLVITRATLAMPPWCFDLQRISGVNALNYGTIHECAKKLIDFQNAMLDSMAIRTDPSTNSIFLKYKEVSSLRPPSILPLILVPPQPLSTLFCAEEVFNDEDKTGKYMEITL